MEGIDSSNTAGAGPVAPPAGPGEVVVPAGAIAARVGELAAEIGGLDADAERPLVRVRCGPDR